MNAPEQAHFQRPYAQLLRALTLHGKAEKTIDRNARAAHRAAAFFE